MIVVDATDQSGERPPRGGRKHPLVTDDGFGEHAVVVDEAAGCHLWQGNMNGPEPRASLRMARINPRILAYERAGKTVPAGHRLVPSCGRQRCIRPDHQAPMPRKRPPPPPSPPKPRPTRDAQVRRELTERLPAERPPHIRGRDWAALSGVLAGKTYADVGAELGVSRQRIGQMVERARRQFAEPS